MRRHRTRYFIIFRYRAFIISNDSSKNDKTVHTECPDHNLRKLWLQKLNRKSFNPLIDDRCSVDFCNLAQMTRKENVVRRKRGGKERRWTVWQRGGRRGGQQWRKTVALGQRGQARGAGRKREINTAWQRGGEGEWVRTRKRHAMVSDWSPGLELELDGSPARKIHIFKYFSHGSAIASSRSLATYWLLPITYLLLC